MSFDLDLIVFSDWSRFVSSRSGHILEIDYVAVGIKNIRRLLPAQESHAHQREKQTFNTGENFVSDTSFIMAHIIAD